jgi:hypothetical protein
MVASFKMADGIANSVDLIETAKWRAPYPQPVGPGYWVPIGDIDYSGEISSSTGGVTLTKVWRRLVVSTDSGVTENVFETIGGGVGRIGPGVVQIHLFRSTYGFKLPSLGADACSGNDATLSGTSVDAGFATNYPFVVGDMAVVCVSMCTNTVSHSSQVLNIPGCTLDPFYWTSRVACTQSQTVSGQMGYGVIASGSGDTSGFAQPTYTAISNTAGHSAVSAVLVKLSENIPAAVAADYPAKSVTGFTGFQSPRTPVTNQLHGRQVTFQP